MVDKVKSNHEVLVFAAISHFESSCEIFRAQVGSEDHIMSTQYR